MRGKHILFITLIIFISSCSKGKVETKIDKCFSSGEVGNKLTYQKIGGQSIGSSDTVTIDTIVSELISVSNNIHNFSNPISFTNLSVGYFFGGVKSFSPLKIDTLVKCNSKVGNSYTSSNNGFNYIPEYTIESTTASFMFKGMPLECYHVKYYDGECTTNYYINKKYGIVSKSGGCPLWTNATYTLIDANF